MKIDKSGIFKKIRNIKKYKRNTRIKKVYKRKIKAIKKKSKTEYR